MGHPITSTLPAVFVHVRDLARAVQFYSALVDKPYDPNEDYGNGIYVIRLDNQADLILDANHAEQVGKDEPFPMHAQCMFRTDDIDAARAWLQEQDATIVTEVYRDPNVAFFNFQDPDGNVQMICQSL